MWTRAVPTIPGWYFWRRDTASRWSVREVGVWPGGGLAVRDTYDWITPEQAGGEWQGPIVPQEEPVEARQPFLAGARDNGLD